MIEHVVFDRDGTLIRYIPYLCDPLAVELLPGVARNLERLRAAGCQLYLHTNQSGIGRGLFSTEDAAACNMAMIRQIGLGPDVFAEVCMSPESPDEPTVTRKPSANWGVDLMARKRFGPDALCYVGDAVSDLLTANTLGCYGVGVDTGKGALRAELERMQLSGRFVVTDSFERAVDQILAFRRQASGFA